MSTKTKGRPFSVTVPHEVSEKDVANLLVSAFEGGSTYWLGEIEIKVRAEGFGSPRPGHTDYYPTIIRVPMSGGTLLIRESDSDDPPKELNRAALQRGLELMAKLYPKHWSDFISEGDDATTADVFLQLALLGELVYG